MLVKKLLSFVALMLAMTFGVSSAEALEYSEFVDTLEQSRAEGKMLSLVDASLGSIAWACAKDADAEDGIEFDACCHSAADLIVSADKKNNMYGVALIYSDFAIKKLGVQDHTVDEFWQAYGVSTGRASRCAKAIYEYRQAEGFWATLYAEYELSSCLPRNLAPQLASALQIRRAN